MCEGLFLCGRWWGIIAPVVLPFKKDMNYLVSVCWSVAFSISESRLSRNMLPINAKFQWVFLKYPCYYQRYSQCYVLISVLCVNISVIISVMWYFQCYVVISVLCVNISVVISVMWYSQCYVVISVLLSVLCGNIGVMW